MTFSIHYSFLHSKLLFESLLEIMPVITGNVEPKNRDKLIFRASPRMIGVQDSDAEQKTKEFSSKIIPTSSNLPIESLMKEIKPVVTEKNEFEKRGKNFLHTFFWTSLTIKILMQGSKNFSI